MPSAPQPDWNTFAKGFGRRADQSFGHVKGFWQRVTEGLQLQELWAQFKAEARESYGLYSKEIDWDALQKEKKGRRGLLIAKALFWAMIMKMSPARRVFLLVGLVFVLLALTPAFQFQSGNTSVVGIGGNNGLFVVLASASFLVLLALELADRVTMKRDLEIAREIQHWLVPASAPEVPGVDIAFRTRPANTVAGDYYDAFLRSGDGSGPEASRLLVVVADVAGKSVPAALLMATLQASLRTLALQPTSLVELVDGLNLYACAHSLGGQRFTTAFIAELDPLTLEMNYVNAGHNPPILRRESGQIERLREGGVPFGIMHGARYQSGAVRLGRGDFLIVFTDGVIEAENERGEEYGEERLLKLVTPRPQGDAATAIDRLMSALDAFVGAARQHDDVTCLILRCS